MPHFRIDIELIEGVHRRATKLVKNVEHLHYNDRLEHLGADVCSYKTIQDDLIDTYKIIDGIYNVITELFFDYDQSGRRGHSKKLFKRRSRLDIRKFALSNRISPSRQMEFVVECCVTCNSIDCFKSQISSKLEPETS